MPDTPESLLVCLTCPIMHVIELDQDAERGGKRRAGIDSENERFNCCSLSLPFVSSPLPSYQARPSKHWERGSLPDHLELSNWVSLNLHATNCLTSGMKTILSSLSLESLSVFSEEFRGKLDK